MSVQVKHRRDTATNIAGFTPAQGELIVDTTNNRLIVGDGATVGGIPAAKLSEAGGSAPTRTPVADANYTALTTDRNVAIASITAARTITLPAASAYPQGTRLTVFDESGAVTATNTITLARAGSDTINGATSAVIASAFGFLAVETNGSAKWTVTDQSASNLPAVGIGTAADPSNPLCVYGATALFNGTNFSFTLNKSAVGNTASVLFQDAFSARAQIGLLGSDNFSFKVSPNGSTYSTGLIFDAATGSPTFGNARTAVSDAAYTALATDREVAYTAITAARVVTLPAASAFPAGHPLVILDESGAVSLTNTISVTAAGTETISGRASAKIMTAYGHIRLVSNGSNAWTVAGRSANILTLSTVGANTYVLTPGLVKAEVFLVAGGGGGGGGALQAASTAVSGGAGGGGGGLAFGQFTAAQIGASQSVTIGAGGTAGVKAASNSSNGGNGGAGGNTSFGSLLVAYGGGAGSGGQLTTSSGGGGGGGQFYAPGPGTATAGGYPTLQSGAGGFGGAGAWGSAPFGAGGGGGGNISGASFPGGEGIGMGAGGASGGGISSANVLSAGGVGGVNFYYTNGSTNGGAAGTISGGAGGAGAALTNPFLNAMGGNGGGGGGSSSTAAGGGGPGGLYGGGGGGGGSAQNGGTAGAGGAGGAGYAIIVEYF